MPDKGISRVVGRELFGLAVRLTGLWVGYISGFALVVQITSDFISDSTIVSPILGLAIGVALVWKADLLCRMSYGAVVEDAPRS